MRWTNWAGTASAEDVTRVEPSSTAEVSALLRDASDRGRRVRPVGSGHSFGPIGQPADLAVDLTRLSGVRGIDGPRVRVGAGVRLADLNRALDALGRALPNLGDIDRQTLAGALATGTHGTGGVCTAWRAPSPASRS